MVNSTPENPEDLEGSYVEKYMYPNIYPLKDRTWVDVELLHPPAWCSVDLRDGNQALTVPMSPLDKLELFKTLIDVGFKEIEVGFPAASKEDYDFLRMLIEGSHIPPDVTIQVLTQIREDLVSKTFKAVQGAENVIVHFYNSTSPVQRDIVFNASQEEVKELALTGAKMVLDYAKLYSETSFTFQYSPESFTATEIDYALDVCRGVLEVLYPESKVIINLPATVETYTPDRYADAVEFFVRNLILEHPGVVLSIHPHNDRGTAVAAAELALKAGATRVEGCLFGNGERTGNVCLPTLALNFMSTGVDPGLDFSDIDQVAEVYTRTTGMSIHPRHPYVGSLVYTAFSGSHQDAINKGLLKHLENPETWNVPYLPIDPKDVGRTYEALVRVNTQSGKAGPAFVLRQEHGMDLPKRLQVEFSKIVQKYAHQNSSALTPDELKKLFMDTYLYTDEDTIWSVKGFKVDSVNMSETKLTLDFAYMGRNYTVSRTSHGLLEALSKIFIDMGVDVRVADYYEHALNMGTASSAISYVELAVGSNIRWGAALDPSVVASSVKAFFAALNSLGDIEPQLQMLPNNSFL